MPSWLARPLLALALLSRSLAGLAVGAPLEATTEPEDARALGADDECVQKGAVETESCGLNALQRHGTRLADERLAEGGTAAGPGDEELLEEGAVEPKVGPWQQCGGKTYSGSTECAEGYTCWPQSEWYHQCRPSDKVKKTWSTYTGGAALNKSSSAPLLTFYMYRAMGPNTYPAENVNTATLGGVIWYVHNEVVSCAYGDCNNQRRFGIERIVRYKVQTKAPQPLWDAGMNFGIRYAYDHGQCTGPWKCDAQFEKYGYFVGCNNLSSGFPFPDWQVYYSGAWYSLPGSCSAMRAEEQSETCKSDQPGGKCQGMPTGTGTCTYNIEEVGQIMIDELEGIDDYKAFKDHGGEEFNKKLDKGVHMTFWNNMNDTRKNAERVHKADLLFKKKYPDMPLDEELPPPRCDFDKPLFFPDGLPTAVNPATEEAEYARLGKSVD